MAVVDLPPDLPDWMASLGQDSVRSLSVTMLIDLFTLERDKARASEIAADMEALAEDLAVVGRLDWTATPGLLAGASVYHGNSGQDQAGLGSTGVTLAEVHGEWRARGLWLRALAAMSDRL